MIFFILIGSLYKQVSDHLLSFHTWYFTKDNLHDSWNMLKWKKKNKRLRKNKNLNYKHPSVVKSTSSNSHKISQNCSAEAGSLWWSQNGNLRRIQSGQNWPYLFSTLWIFLESEFICGWKNQLQLLLLLSLLKPLSPILSKSFSLFPTHLGHHLCPHPSQQWGTSFHLINEKVTFSYKNAKFLIIIFNPTLPS